jgi:WD40 repeat protein
VTANPGAGQERVATSERLGTEATQPAPDDVVAGRRIPSAEADAGLWSYVIDLGQTVDDADTIAEGSGPARDRPRWLWPVVAAGSLLLALLAVWAVGTFRVRTAEEEKVKLTRAEVRSATGGRTRSPERLVPPGESGSGKAPSPAGDASNNARAPAPPPVTKTSSPGATPQPTSPAPAESSSASKAAPPAGPAPMSRPAPTPSGARTASEELRVIASIRTSDPAIQARLLPDALHILYETRGKEPALWRGDIRDPKNPRKLQSDVPGWVHLALSSDGKFAIVATKDHSLWNWDLQTGRLQRLRTARAALTAIAISPDCLLVAFVRDGAIQSCDPLPDARRKRRELGGPFGSQTELIAFCPDGRRLVSTHADRSIRIWDVWTGRELARSDAPKPVSGLAAFPDVRRVLISLSGPASVWDVPAGRELRLMPGSGGSIAVSADGRRALIGGGNFMRLADLETGAELGRRDHQRAVLSAAFSADGRQAVSTTEESVHVWALPTGGPSVQPAPVVEIDRIRDRTGILYAVAVSPDGRWILTGGWPNTMRLWEVDTGQLRGTYDESGKTIGSVAFSPVRSMIALSGGLDGVVRLWDLDSGAFREFRGHADEVMSVAFSPDGRRAYSAGGREMRAGEFQDGSDFAVRVWDLEAGAQLRPLEGHKRKVLCVAVSPNGRRVLSGGRDATPILWDARTGHVIHRLQGHTDGVESLAFLPPDGRRAVSSGLDGKIRLWDLDAGREIQGHFQGQGTRHNLAVSQDGTRLLSADGGGRGIWYWNVETGTVIQKIPWEAAPTKGCFTLDGRHAIWGGWDGIARIYLLADTPGRPIDAPRRPPGSRKRSGSSPAKADQGPAPARGVSVESPPASPGSTAGRGG